MRKYLLSVAMLLVVGIATTAQNLKLSQKHGFYDKPFELTITDDDNLVNDGAAIRYTLDGSVPTIESAAYTNPISIKGNTILRTAVVGADGLLSNVTQQRISSLMTCCIRQIRQKGIQWSGALLLLSRALLLLTMA